MVKRANRPGAPEHSIPLRVASAAAVLTGIAATRAEGELSTLVAILTGGLVAVGMVFSYLTRERPQGWVKPTLAIAVVVAFSWFFYRITSHTVTDISAVESPLAVLFAWIQVTHAFDVPARRDLSFSLAGSASLMAVAAAQAVDLAFGIYVLAWLVFGLWGLMGMWRSASEGGRPGLPGVVGSLAAVAAVALVVVAVLPAPHVAQNISFPSASPGDVAIPGQGTITGDGKNPNEPAKAGAPGGPTQVGGFLGFSKHLDTALRASLGNQVIMRVRGSSSSYWIGETFDQWDGTSWISTGRNLQQVGTGSPFGIPEPNDQNSPGTPTLQTFYLATYGPNLIFHAANARVVWFPAGHLFVGSDGTVLSPVTMGPGTIYTVQSSVNQASPALLRGSSLLGDRLPSGALKLNTQLPQSYTRVANLARAITDTQPTTYDKVEALISWIGSNTHYSTNIPPLPKGADTVDNFLFGSRIGFCEQISTTLAVMLRSLGIPAREAVGYVGGSYNPITDLWEVRANDAHAWVQVWFPGFGWQSFDPTAAVPGADPTPGTALLRDAGGPLSRLPVVPIGVTLAVVTLLVVVRRWWQRRPGSWEEELTGRIERVGIRAGRRRRPDETLTEYAGALDTLAGDRSGTFRSLAWMVEESAYGGRPPSAESRRRALETVRSVRIDRGPAQADQPAQAVQPGR